MSRTIELTEKEYDALVDARAERDDYMHAVQYTTGFLVETRRQFREASDNGRDCDAAYFKGVINGISTFDWAVVNAFKERTTDYE